jgi:hypothetical protein
MEIETHSFCPKCKVNVHKNRINQHLKSEKHLIASGIFDTVKKTFNNVVDRFKGKRLDGFNRVSTKTLEENGKSVITSLTIARKPISRLLDTVINAISFNKWNKLKDEQGFDKLFHLCLIAKLANGKTIYIEKIDAVTISPVDNITSSETQYLDVPLVKGLTLNTLVQGAREKLNNDKLFFGYSAFGDGKTEPGNCQVFLKYLLENAGLWNENTKRFVFQDVTQIASELPSLTKKIMNFATDLGAVSNTLLGKGENFAIHAIKINKNVPINEAIKHVQHITKSKKRKYVIKDYANYNSFRIIARTKFIKNSYRSKKVNKDITLVFGVLKD